MSKAKEVIAEISGEKEDPSFHDLLDRAWLEANNTGMHLKKALSMTGVESEVKAIEAMLQKVRELVADLSALDKALQRDFSPKGKKK